MSRRCAKGHRALFVEDLTPLGAFVECLDCRTGWHILVTDMEKDYTPFHHNSPKGPEGDMVILLLDSYLNEEER